MHDVIETHKGKPLFTDDIVASQLVLICNNYLEILLLFDKNKTLKLNTIFLKHFLFVLNYK